MIKRKILKTKFLAYFGFSNMIKKEKGLKRL